MFSFRATLTAAVIAAAALTGLACAAAGPQHTAPAAAHTLDSPIAPAVHVASGHVVLAAHSLD